MKGFKLNPFLITILLYPIIATSSVEEIDTTSKDLEQHQSTTIQENYLNTADDHMIDITNDTVDYSQEFFYTEDLQEICHGQVNEFIWKVPIISDNKEKILKFRTIDDQIYSSTLFWYLKSINEIDIIEMNSGTYMHQIEFKINIDEKIISLSELYPTYPEISGFEILQFLANLAFECKFLIHVFDVSDISLIYSALYGRSYYEYHFEGINLNQKLLFKNIIVKKKTFLDCFETKIGYSAKFQLAQIFYENIQICEKAFVSVEFCPILLETQYIFYNNSFQDCIDWSPIGGFPEKTHSFSQFFEIFSEDMDRIMKRKKQSYLNFVKINRELDKKIIKTYDEIKTQIFDTLFLMKLFSNIFQLCFFEMEKIKSNPNPEDIFKLYLRPCVIPNINLFLKYHTNI